MHISRLHIFSQNEYLKKFLKLHLSDRAGVGFMLCRRLIYFCRGQYVLFHITYPALSLP